MRFGRFSGTHPTMGVQHGEAFRDLLQQCRQGLDDLSPDKRLSVDSLIPHFESVLRQRNSSARRPAEPWARTS